MKTPIKNKYLVPSILALAATFAGTQSTYGQSLAAYPFNSGSTASIDSEANSDASAFDVSIIGGTISSGTGTAFIAASATADSEANAIAGNDYFSFTVTPDSGFEMDLTQLAFGTVFSSTDADVVDLAANFFVRSSLDSFASNVSTTFVEDFVSSSTLSFTPRTVTLSGSEFLDVSDAVEFRIYMYDNSGAATRLLRVDNVILSGSVNAIPEVKSFAAYAGLLAIFAVFGARRFKR